MMFRSTLFSLTGGRRYSPAQALALAARLLDVLGRAAAEPKATKLLKEIAALLVKLEKLVG